MSRITCGSSSGTSLTQPVGHAQTQAGFDYAAADCQSWMADIGFRDSYAEPLAGPDSMVVGIK
jgi:hypothetical protein